MVISMKDIIIEKIKNQGKMTFADYMYNVLYDEQAGYYTTKNNVLGTKGDFFTSAHVGNILGETLAEAFIKDVVPRSMFSVVEYGAGEGKIAVAFLNHIEKFYPQIYNKLHFYIVEISPKMRFLQAQNVQAHKEKVSWINSLQKLKPFNGMIYANEFLDALAVHIIKYSKNELKEMYVSLKGHNIVSEYLLLSHNVNKYLEYIPDLPSGSVTEFCISAFEWLRELYDYTDGCNVYVIDYGYTHDQKNTPSRRKKTALRCYKNHTIYTNPFAEIGKRDITADVDFTAIQHVAKKLGFNNEYLVTKSKFILQSELINTITKGKNDFQIDSELEKKLKYVKQLVFPGAMGEIFNVLKIYK